MSHGRSLPASLLLASLLAACGDPGGGPGADAGPVGPVSLAVRSSALVESVQRDGGGVIVPRTGDRFALLAIAISAVAAERAGVASNAFELVLMDGATLVANVDATNEGVEGCRSQSVRQGETLLCNVAFETSADASPGVRLRWTDGFESASAVVPPPE